MPLWTVSPIFLSGTALVAQLPDSAATGGNARGANAVDWQATRSAATQVASGANATIGGGQSNTASNSSATVGGGNANTASGNQSVVSGGGGNAATGVQSVVSGGGNNAATGTLSWVPGGILASTRGIYARGAWAGGRIAVDGDAQCGEQPLLRQTTDATATRLTADGAVAGAANTINMPNFSTYAGTLTIAAKAVGSTAAATFRVSVSAVRGNGAGTVVVYEGAGTGILPAASNGTGSAWRLDIAADTTNGGIAVTVTGAAATTITWSARFSNVEAVTAS